MVTVTERLYMLLKEQGKTSSQLCRKLGIENNVIAGWKKKNDIPPSKYLVNICEFLNVTVDYFLTGQSKTMQVEPEPFESYMRPHPEDLTDDECMLFAMYSHLSPEGKRWVQQFIKGYLKDNENLSSSRGFGGTKSKGEIA